jgi:hypothetical protein
MLLLLYKYTTLKEVIMAIDQNFIKNSRLQLADFMKTLMM